MADTAAVFSVVAESEDADEFRGIDGVAVGVVVLVVDVAAAVAATEEEDVEAIDDGVVVTGVLGVKVGVVVADAVVVVLVAEVAADRAATAVVDDDRTP